MYSLSSTFQHEEDGRAYELLETLYVRTVSRWFERQAGVITFFNTAVKYYKVTFNNAFDYFFIIMYIVLNLYTHHNVHFDLI